MAKKKVSINKYKFLLDTHPEFKSVVPDKLITITDVNFVNDYMHDILEDQLEFTRYVDGFDDKRAMWLCKKYFKINFEEVDRLYGFYYYSRNNYLMMIRTIENDYYYPLYIEVINNSEKRRSIYITEDPNQFVGTCMVQAKEERGFKRNLVYESLREDGIVIEERLINGDFLAWLKEYEEMEEEEDDSEDDSEEEEYYY